MKMLLVAARGELSSTLGFHLKPMGFEIECFDDPIEVISRLDELDPNAILMNVGDFPRHWKPLLSLAREKKPREELVFLLIAPPDFDHDDAAKAMHLGVNGILGENLTDKQELYRLEEIVRRYRTVKDKRNFTRLVPGQDDALGFAFTHPRRMAFVAGRLREISIQGTSFLPAKASATADLPVGTEILRCSLKIEQRIVAVTCKVTRNRDELGFQFLSFEEGGHHALLTYIQARSERALKNASAAANAAAQ
jgi:DNA-binding response OmpR family regulator